MDHLNDEALDQQYFFTLPSSLDPDDVVQLIQPDTISYNLRDLEEEDFTEWRRIRIENEANEENQREIRSFEAIEKRVEASAQVESNRKWISRHSLVAPEVLGGRVESEKGGTNITNNCKYKSQVALHTTPTIPFQIPHYTFITLPLPRSK